MKELKRYDRTSLEFKRAMLSSYEHGVATCALMSKRACLRVIRKSGETLEPVDLLGFIHPVEQYERFTDGVLSVIHGDCSAQESFKIMEGLFEQDARRALTQVLANRQTQRAA
jgi:hypothetical protein